jgi:hypothetical protein
MTRSCPVKIAVRATDKQGAHLVDFGSRGTSHQVFDGLSRGFAVLKDREYLLSDWHLNILLLCQGHRGSSGKNSFRHRSVHAGDDIGQFPAFAKFNTNGAVAGKIAGAG